MAKLNIILDTRRVKDGQQAPLKISISAHGQTALIPIGISINEKQWDKQARKVIKNPNKDVYNMIIDKKMMEYRTKIFDEGKRGMSAVQLRSLLLDEKQQTTLLCDRIDKSIQSCRTDGNKRMYRMMLSSLRKFDGNLSERTIDEIDKEYIENYDRYMSQTMSTNSRSIHMRTLRAVFNSAINDGITKNYPFRKFKIRQEQTRKRALSLTDVKKLKSIQCEEWQEEYRDIFILMLFLIGVNAADLFNASPNAIVDGRFEYTRAKTHKPYSIKVEPEAMEIIERYKGETHLLQAMDRYRDYRDYLHHMNDALKTIGRNIGKQGRVLSKGLFPELSSYWSRHTWATLAASIDIPIETIGRAMGHSTGAAVTNIYIDFDRRKIDDANRKVIDLVCSD